MKGDVLNEDEGFGPQLAVCFPIQSFNSTISRILQTDSQGWGAFATLIILLQFPQKVTISRKKDDYKKIC